MDKLRVHELNWETLILHCTTCCHEVEAVEYRGQKCDWCGGDMVIIGSGQSSYAIKYTANCATGIKQNLNGYNNSLV